MGLGSQMSKKLSYGRSAAWTKTAESAEIWVPWRIKKKGKERETPTQPFRWLFRHGAKCLHLGMNKQICWNHPSVKLRFLSWERNLINFKQGDFSFRNILSRNLLVISISKATPEVYVLVSYSEKLGLTGEEKWK